MAEDNDKDNSISDNTARGYIVPEVQRRLQEEITGVFGDRLIALEPLAWEEYGLAFRLSADSSIEIFSRLKSDDRFSFEMLLDLTGVDWLDRREPRFDVVYQLLSIRLGHRLCLKIQVSDDNPTVPSLCSLWASAKFLEREAFDMFGIRFEGHGDLRRILLYDEFVGYPLRKDYPKRAKQPRLALRIPELHNTSQDMRRDELVALPLRRRGLNTD